MAEKACKNTDRELWREVEGDHSSPSVHVTEGGGIGINVGGLVIVKTPAKWHELHANAERLLRAARNHLRALDLLSYTPGSSNREIQVADAEIRASILACEPKP